MIEYYQIWDFLKFRRNINLFCHSMHNFKPHYVSSLKSREKIGVFPITIQSDFIVFTVLISLLLFNVNYNCVQKHIFTETFVFFVQDESTYLVPFYRTADIHVLSRQIHSPSQSLFNTNQITKGEKPNLNECISKTLNFRTPFLLG